jgi:rod shape-determining protein MreC
MRNLFAFLARYNAFLTFVAFEIISVFLLIKNSEFHQSFFLNSSNALTGSILEKYDNIVGYFDLKKQNEILTAENALLHDSLRQSHYNVGKNTVLVHDTLNHVMYSYIPSRVISITVNRTNNYITIDKGKLQGIAPRMGVIGPMGVVGIVKDVSPHFSTIITLLNSEMKVSARIGKLGFLGTVIWTGSDAAIATLKEIPSQAKVKTGDAVYSSGESLIFPEGVVIGSVMLVQRMPGDNFYTIRIKLSTDFYSLSQVYVVNYLMKKEQENLETGSENDK